MVPISVETINWHCIKGNILFLCFYQSSCLQLKKKKQTKITSSLKNDQTLNYALLPKF